MIFIFLSSNFLFQASSVFLKIISICFFPSSEMLLKIKNGSSCFGLLLKDSHCEVFFFRNICTTKFLEMLMLWIFLAVGALLD